VALAEKLGLMAGQMVDFGIKAIELAYEGEVAKLNAKPLTAAALAGVMRPMLAEVNMVSAPAVAKERGITVLESRQEDSPIYESLIRITVTTEKGKRSFAGSVLAGTPRVVEVKGMDLDAPFGPTMLYVNNLDKPGFIGNLGGLLAEAGVNIATFNLGRVSAGDDAIALVGVDQAPSEALLTKIQGLPHVKEARSLRF
jgi:D-3-phosphoglycerate dehydrogenase